jgi:hypothetical protein
MYREAFALVVGRARLVLAAAVAVGADPEAAERIRTRLDELRIGRRPDAAMESADALLREANALLGSARARAAAQPSTDEVAALVAEATEAGFAVERLERGLVVTLPVRGNSARPGDGAIAALARLVAAHPHGPVRIEVTAPNRRAQAQADALVGALTDAGAGRERLGATGIEGAPRVDAVFVSYVPR